MEFMPTTYSHDVSFPFSAWWFIVAGIVLLLLLCALVAWRKYYLTYLSAFSLVLTVLLLADMLLPRATACHVGIAWKGRKASDGIWISSVTINVVNGAFALNWCPYTEPKGWNYARDYILGLQVLRGTNLKYPLAPDRFSAIKSNFIRETLGFDFCWWDGLDPGTGNDVHMHLFILPLWFVLLLCIPFPGFAVKRHLRKAKIRRWLATGHCGRCGFDLRAHKPGDKCPECRALVPAPPSTPAPRAQTPPA
jgi:hypothetical protein